MYTKLIHLTLTVNIFLYIQRLKKFKKSRSQFYISSVQTEKKVVQIVQGLYIGRGIQDQRSFESIRDPYMEQVVHMEESAIWKNITLIYAQGYKRFKTDIQGLAGLWFTGEVDAVFGVLSHTPKGSILAAVCPTSMTWGSKGWGQVQVPVNFREIETPQTCNLQWRKSLICGAAYWECSLKQFLEKRKKRWISILVLLYS